MSAARRIAFASFGRIGVIDEDGGNERYLDFDRPGQKSWALGPELGDGRRIVLTSREETAIEKEVVGDLTTHTWLLDTTTGGLSEIMARDRPSTWLLCLAFLPGGERLVAAAMQDGEQRLHVMELDGAHRRELTSAGAGFHYGVELSPDGRSLACHVTGGKQGGARLPYPSYSIHVIGIASGERTVMAGDPDRLFFGPTWSRDGSRLAFVGCRYRADPAHFWADISVAEVASRESHAVTSGDSHWFGTSYGPAESRGGGSNTTAWVGDSLSYTRKMPGSHPDCEHHPERPDHQENVFSPASARGGTQICLIDPRSGAVRELTSHEEGRWDFRPRWSRTADRVVFARARVTKPAELWIMDADGSHPRFLTRGHASRGADHPSWVSVAL